jgi:hypothetical protein
LLTAQEVGGRSRVGPLLLSLGQVVLEDAELALRDVGLRRDPYTDENPDDQRQEDGRQRGNVIAKVEQEREA